MCNHQINILKVKMGGIHMRTLVVHEECIVCMYCFIPKGTSQTEVMPYSEKSSLYLLSYASLKASGSVVN